MRTSLIIILSLLLCTACSETPKTEQPAKSTKQVKKAKPKSHVATTEKNEEEEDSPTVYKEALKAEINDVCAKLPVTVEPGVTVENFTVEGNDAVYYYMCEEPKVNIDAVEQAKTKMKERTRESLKTTNDPETIHLLRMLNGGQMGLIFRYKGTKNGKAVDVVFSPADVTAIIESQP